MKYYLAIDLGATSGRAVVGYQNNEKEIIMDEIHRFKTGVDYLECGYCWDIPRIYDEIVKGIKLAFKKYEHIESLAIDSWGVDYVLLDKENKPILPYYSYRNERTNESLIKEVHDLIPFKDLYLKTGIQFASFNSIYQLYADSKENRLNKACSILMLPEYFSYLLTDKKAKEYTMASTTGLLNCKTKEIDEEILQKLHLPSFIKEPLVKPGYVLGNLKSEIVKEVNGNCKVILVASHDTASAFESIDCDDKSIIISSGTWSLLGIKANNAIINDLSFKANYTNEGGVNYIRFLKNIMGMWIPNNVATILNLNIPTLCKKLKEPDFNYYFDANDESLLNPPNMYEAVLKLLPRKPKNNEELFEAIYLSLALCYQKAIIELEKITNQKYDNIYIIGGGANNKYLNNLVSNVTKKEVIALPIEATCLGNLKIQMKENENE